MACCILLLLWVKDELSYDQFHEKIEDLYIIGTDVQIGTEIVPTQGTPPALGPAFKAEYPEVVNTARLLRGQRTMALSDGSNHFSERIQAADPALLGMFSFELLSGDASTALLDPLSIVMSKRMADKYFGDEDPVGRTLTLEQTYFLTVTGVFEDIPPQSSIQFDFLVPLRFFGPYSRDNYDNDKYLGTWYNLSFQTFAELSPETSVENFNLKINDRIIRAHDVQEVRPFVSRFDGLYLYGVKGRGGQIKQVIAFSLIALMILLIACVNFTNLTTARSGARAKEIGARKVVGASRSNIVRQFYAESLLLAFISLCIALVLVWSFVPAFNSLSGKQLGLNPLENPGLILGLIAVALLTGIVSGSYPALVLSSFKPVLTLNRRVGTANSNFMTALVVAQFAASIILIIGTAVIYRQTSFLHNANLGFDEQQLIHVPLSGRLEKSVEAAKDELLQHPGILSVTTTSHSPTGIYENGSNWSWDGKPSNTDPLITYLGTDSDFLKTFDVQMNEGRYYTIELDTKSSDSTRQIVINETLAKMMDVDEIIGARLLHGAESYTIIGVMNDFNYKPLDTRIGPMIISNGSFRQQYLFIKIRPEAIPESVAHVEAVYKQFNPGFPFIYQFLDDDLDILYRREQTQYEILGYFALIAIFISCLGLFALASLMVARRTKEFGIRKVFGASTSKIVTLISKDFLMWIAGANIIAWPIAWILSNAWLSGFAYRIEIGLIIFLITAFSTLAIALLTVSYQASRAALSNPIKSLRYD